MKRYKNKLNGYSLVELLLAIGIFGIMSSMLIFLVIDATRTLENTRDRSKASQLTQDIYTSLKLIKSKGWFELAKHTNDGPKHVEYVSGRYVIVDGEISQGELTYSFTINEIQRDINRQIVDIEGTNDPHTRMISINISWIDRIGKTHTINPNLYVNDWNTNSITWTTQLEFDTGIYTDTMSINEEGGEVSLQTMLYSDWCNPSPPNEENSYEIPGNGVPKTLSTYNDTVIMGSGDNASGDPFIKLTAIEDLATNMPVVSDQQLLVTNYKTNDIFLLNNTTALLATDTNSSEVLILELNSTLNQIGYFDIPTNTDGNTISGYDTRGFVTAANNLISFDISTILGSSSQPILQTVSLGGLANKTTATDIFVDEQYIYLTLSEHDNEFVIYEHTPTISLVAQADLGDLNATALFISEDKTKAFIGTENSTTANEFYILDISNKSNISVLASQDLQGMSVNALVSIDDRVMIGGVGGQEYQVLNIENLQTPTTCGSLTLGVSINDMSLVQTANSNYTYVLTTDGYLQFIRGGKGGGGIGGDGYIESGGYLSEIYDSGTDTSVYYVLSIQADIPTGTSPEVQPSLHVQLRSSNDPTMAGSIWMGPDGTSNTSFDSDGVFYLPTSLYGRYFQYKANFTSDTVNTPLLKEIIINYEK
jgi:type II secretory pathway pseudopilin PulG